MGDARRETRGLRCFGRSTESREAAGGKSERREIRVNRRTPGRPLARWDAVRVLLALPPGERLRGGETVIGPQQHFTCVHPCYSGTRHDQPQAGKPCGTGQAGSHVLGVGPSSTRRGWRVV